MRLSEPSRSGIRVALFVCVSLPLPLFLAYKRLYSMASSRIHLVDTYLDDALLQESCWAWLEVIRTNISLTTLGVAIIATAEGVRFELQRTSHTLICVPNL